MGLGRKRPALISFDERQSRPLHQSQFAENGVGDRFGVDLVLVECDLSLQLVHPLSLPVDPPLETRPGSEFAVRSRVLHHPPIGSTDAAPDRISPS
jgi:hypothetical protein